MVELPTDLWARVLRFSGQAVAAAAARVFNAAVPVCLANLAASGKGTAEYLRAVPQCRLAEAFGAEQLFGQDLVLAGHFALNRPVVVAYLRAAASSPTLSDLIVWLFKRPDLQSLLQPMHRRTSPETLGLSFGIVRARGMFPRWVISPATADVVATNLLRALQGIVRAHRPDFGYIWVHISTSSTLRHPFTYARDAVTVSLTTGLCYDLPGGAGVPKELLEPGE
jgi:hypothetical protein